MVEAGRLAPNLPEGHCLRLRVDQKSGHGDAVGS